MGLAGAFCALTHAPGPTVIAIPLSLTAMVIGGVTVWSIRRARAARRGRGVAISGVGLGATVTLISVLILVNLISRQINQQRQWQQNRDQAMQRQAAMARSAIPDVPAAAFTSNLPIIILRIGAQSNAKGSETVVRAQVFDTGNQRASIGAKPDYDGLGTIQRRGNTSLHLPKKSYTFHTVDNKNNQIKVSLLGLPKEEDWVLYAPFEDKTLLRDVLAFELARQMGRYAPRTRHVELFIQTDEQPLSMRDYAGVYVLMEKIKRGKDRVNIAKLESQHRAEPEITGGYIIKRDHNESDGNRFHTEHGGPYFYVYPKASEITSGQKSWLARYFNSFEAALYGDNFRDPQTGYAAYLDVDSFIDAHWLIEATKNVDGFRYSAFLTKDRGGKLKPEPPWDWNRSFGNANYYGGGQPQGWYWTNLRPNEISWFMRLQEDPNFRQRCATRWLQLRQDVFDPGKINARIDELAAQLEEAQQRNFERWPVLGQQITCNFYVGQSFQDEVRWMKNWIERRIAWIDGQLGGPTKL